MAGSDVVAREVVVHGRVQGVFFRATCQREARDRGLTGWVTNEPDGTVRAWFEGAADDVDAICGWCHQGPRGAAVERVDTTDRTPEGHRSFAVR